MTAVDHTLVRQTVAQVQFLESKLNSTIFFNVSKDIGISGLYYKENLELDEINFTITQSLLYLKHL